VTLQRDHVRLLVVLSCVFATLLLPGCKTHSPAPPADFSAPGWQIREGQAVWRASRGRSELTGELVAATRTNGDFFLQFGKPPFTLATAQITHGQWQLAFGQKGHAWAGRGDPPSRCAWFELRRVLIGMPRARDWQLHGEADALWKLENVRTGETLEGRFFP
jgi:hypothetical protein